jgi:hypothetical protein
MIKYTPPAEDPRFARMTGIDLPICRNRQHNTLNKQAYHYAADSSPLAGAPDINTFIYFFGADQVRHDGDEHTTLNK